MSAGIVDRVALEVHDALCREPRYAGRMLDVGDIVEYNGATWILTGVHRLEYWVSMECVATAKDGSRLAREIARLQVSDLVAHPTTHFRTMGKPAYDRLCAAIDPMRRAPDQPCRRTDLEPPIPTELGWPDVAAAGAGDYRRGT